MLISRNPQKSAEKPYDAIIIGGGIYGITLALEAGLRGLKILLLEKGDFGEQTSFNSLKIVHGGLRYLQSLDLHRFKESVGERAWFLRHFPKHVLPLPCFMPLYGKGTRRPSVFKVALLANHLLSINRNDGIRPDHHLPAGQVVGVRQCKEIFPLLDLKGLKGGAVWYDAYMPDSQLLIIDLLLAACGLGSTPLNYFNTSELLTDSQGNVRGVSATDRETGKSHEFHADLIINAAGPWCREVVEGIKGTKEELFRPALAWNVLFKRKALSDHAVAVQSKEPGSRLYFITPWKGKMFAGTGHEPWSGGPGRPLPTRKQMLDYIQALNKAVPGLGLGITDVARIFSGLLPTTETGSSKLTKREVIIDHHAEGGPKGLYSVGGIKFTTARLVAEKILDLAGLGKPAPFDETSNQVSYPEISKDNQGIDQYRQLLAEDKSIVHLDDFFLRRTTLWENADKAMILAEKLCTLFPWNEDRKRQELEKCKACFQALPPEV